MAEAAITSKGQITIVEPPEQIALRCWCNVVAEPKSVFELTVAIDN